MNSKIQTLKSEVFSRLQKATAGSHVDETLRLAPILNRLTSLEKDAKNIEEELEHLSGILSNKNGLSLFTNKRSESLPADINRKGTHTILRIKINWSLAGKSAKSEDISERNASDTMAKFIGRLIDELGASAKEKILRFGHEQGKQPHVTNNPKADKYFRNQQTGGLYAYSPIPGADLYVLTNINTEAKQEALENLVKYLRLPSGFASINIVQKGTIDGELVDGI